MEDFRETVSQTQQDWCIFETAAACIWPPEVETRSQSWDGVADSVSYPSQEAICSWCLLGKEKVFSSRVSLGLSTTLTGDQFCNSNSMFLFVDILFCLGSFCPIGLLLVCVDFCLCRLCFLLLPFWCWCFERTEIVHDSWCKIQTSDSTEKDNMPEMPLC